MHFVVMVVAAILIVSFFMSNPGALGKLVSGFLIGIGIFVVILAIGSVLPDTKSSSQQPAAVTMSDSEIQKQADANVQKMLFDFGQRKMNAEQQQTNLEQYQKRIRHKHAGDHGGNN